MSGRPEARELGRPGKQELGTSVKNSGGNGKLSLARVTRSGPLPDLGLDLGLDLSCTEKGV